MSQSYTCTYIDWSPNHIRDWMSSFYVNILSTVGIVTHSLSHVEHFHFDRSFAISLQSALWRTAAVFNRSNFQWIEINCNISRLLRGHKYIALTRASGIYTTCNRSECFMWISLIHMQRKIWIIRNKIIIFSR